MPRLYNQITAFILLSMATYLLCLPFIQYPLTTILKPIPIFLLIVLSLQVGSNPHAVYYSRSLGAITQSRQAAPKRLNDQLILVFALFFSLLGDCALTLPIKPALLLGILFFMLVHCAYITLFLRRAGFQSKGFIAFLPVMVFIVVAFWTLWPFLGEMRVLGLLYLILLSLMVFSAFQVTQKKLLVTGGALLFLLSDFVVALNEFIFFGDKGAKLVGMLLYYAAQFLLVVGIRPSLHSQ